MFVHGDASWCIVLTDLQVVEPQDLCEMDGPVLHLLGETDMIPLALLLAFVVCYFSLLPIL